jgi:hypothetical protein
MNVMDTYRLAAPPLRRSGAIPAKSSTAGRACRTGIVLLCVALAAGCGALPPPPAAPQAAVPLGPTPGSPRATPTEDGWRTLFQRTPYPYTAPIPAPSPSPLDGTYVKTDPSQAEHVHCLRCPDYLPEGGLWKLSFDRGIFRIYYPVTGWRSLGSYTIAGDEIRFFNDPNCPEAKGSYTWQMAGGKLVFRVIEDECSTRLRAANLTKQPWLSCRPPNREAMVTDHWAKPLGCD